MWYAWVALMALVVVSPVAAQDAAREPRPTPLERAGITGSIRAGYWSSTRNLDSEDHLGAGMFWIKAARPLSSRVSLLAEGWAAVRGPLDAGDITGDLREGFVELRLGRLDLRAGRQIIAWGRADGINPTNNLTGEDLTLLAPDDEDRRRGMTAVRASYYVEDDVSLTAIWMPEFRPHRFPLPPTPSGFRVVRDTIEWPGDQWAVRAEQTGRAVDWSVSVFRGRDVLPDVSLRSNRDDDVAVALSHRRVVVVGGDVAGNAGRFGLRAEAAYVRTGDPDGTNPFTKNPFVFAVAGADRTFGERLNLNLQYVYRYVVNYHDPRDPVSSPSAAIASLEDVISSQTRAVQHGASFRISYKWLHDTLEAEYAAAGYFDPRGAAMRPKIAYAVSDHWRALAGAEIFRGESSALFGLLRSNSTVYVEARWIF